FISTLTALSDRTCSTLITYTTLFRSLREQLANPHVHFPPDRRVSVSGLAAWMQRGVEELGARIVIVDHFHRMDFGTTSQNFRVADRKSTRLNSSHVKISYAVFCLKKK